jgi:branched-chain amino acid transport system ATP-binding protein
MTEPVLRVVGLSRRFGGLMAVDSVSLSCHHGKIHALIGPNGAGKSTLISLLSGELPADSGRILFLGKDVCGAPVHRLSQRGIGRSYQKTNIFPSFTVFENCRLAAQSRLPSSLHFFREPERCREVNESAAAALLATGLSESANVPAGVLSHGAQRQLEIAMTLVLRPKLLMLDEPLAGMGPEESARMIELLQSLREEHAILLVEHDMDAVFALADVLTVMVNGKVLASGAPQTIRGNSQVQAAYLGL